MLIYETVDDFLGAVLGFKLFQLPDRQKFVQLGDFLAARVGKKGMVRRDYGRGWLLYYLVSLPHVSSVIEIGTGRGYSTVSMLWGLLDSRQFKEDQVGMNLITVDVRDPRDKRCVHYYNGNEENRSTEYLIDTACEQFGIAWVDYIDLCHYVGDSISFLKEVNLDDVNLIFIDGCHTYANVKQEIRHIRKRVGGRTVIVMHDYAPKNAIGKVVQEWEEVDDSFEFFTVKTVTEFSDIYRCPKDSNGYCMVAIKE